MVRAPEFTPTGADLYSGQSLQLGTLEDSGHTRRAERRVTVPGAPAGVPLTPTVPFPVLSHSGHCCCGGRQLRAAVESNCLQMHPDSLTLGLAAVCTPPVLLLDMACPQKPRGGHSCTTPKNWALTYRGPPVSWDGRSVPSPCRLAALSALHKPPQKVHGQSAGGAHAACTVTHPALLSLLLC